MKLTFVSNYLNHHQIPVSNRLYQKLGADYHFIQTEPMEEERLKLGWGNDFNHIPYLLEYYKDPETCQNLIDESDVVVFGGTDDESYIQTRLQQHRLILRYSERIYKTGQWKAISPRGLKQKYHDHIRYRKAPVYLLCAGGYVASDFHLIHSYPGKMLKWGYFPETDDTSVEELLNKKEHKYASPDICPEHANLTDQATEHSGDNADTIIAPKLPECDVAQNPAQPQILWVARLIDWKHPEAPLQLAQRLKTAGEHFHITMIGGGYMETEVQRQLQDMKLQDVVTLKGVLKPVEVRAEMQASDILLFTSDFQEGWGAVLNEAMNSACAVVVNHGIGAAPFLIKQGQNGYVYQNGNINQLENIVTELLHHPEHTRELGQQANATIRNTWNAELAADRLLEEAQYILEHNTPKYWGNGPCSKAEPISPRRMYRKIVKHEL